MMRLLHDSSTDQAFDLFWHQKESDFNVSVV